MVRALSRDLSHLGCTCVCRWRQMHPHTHSPTCSWKFSLMQTTHPEICVKTINIPDSQDSVVGMYLCACLSICVSVCVPVSAHTHTLTHSFTPSLLHSFTPSLLHSFTPSLLHSFTPSLLHSHTRAQISQWCGHCKRAKPEFEAAADTLKDNRKCAPLCCFLCLWPLRCLFADKG